MCTHNCAYTCVVFRRIHQQDFFLRLKTPTRGTIPTVAASGSWSQQGLPSPPIAVRVAVRVFVPVRAGVRVFVGVSVFEGVNVFRWWRSFGGCYNLRANIAHTFLICPSGWLQPAWNLLLLITKLHGACGAMQ
ncbi:MAG: hypothetical protein RLY87_2084 [Chloroflexota bacterium]